MPREKKDNHPITIRMEASIYEKLNEYCRETGLTKTAAIERAIDLSISDFKAKKKILRNNPLS